MNQKRRSFDDPMIYVTKDRNHGFHSYFLSFFIALLQAGLLIWGALQLQEGYSITDLIRWNLAAFSTLCLVLALIFRRRFLMLPILCIYWSFLLLALFVIVYLAGLIIIPELFAYPLLTKMEYYDFLASNSQRKNSVYTCSFWSLIYCGLAIAWCLPLVTLVKCYNYLGGLSESVTPDEDETVIPRQPRGKTNQLI